jgi:hypothetical protein
MAGRGCLLPWHGNVATRPCVQLALHCLAVASGASQCANPAAAVSLPKLCLLPCSSSLAVHPPRCEQGAAQTAAHTPMPAAAPMGYPPSTGSAASATAPSPTSPTAPRPLCLHPPLCCCWWHCRACCQGLETACRLAVL